MLIFKQNSYSIYRIMCLFIVTCKRLKKIVFSEFCHQVFSFWPLLPRTALLLYKSWMPSNSLQAYVPFVLIKGEMGNKQMTVERQLYFLFSFHLKLFSFFICASVNWKDQHTMAHFWNSEDNPLKLVLFSQQWSTKDQMKHLASELTYQAFFSFLISIDLNSSR